VGGNQDTHHRRLPCRQGHDSVRLRQSGSRCGRLQPEMPCRRFTRAARGQIGEVSVLVAAEHCAHPGPPIPSGTVTPSESESETYRAWVEQFDVAAFMAPLGDSGGVGQYAPHGLGWVGDVDLNPGCRLLPVQLIVLRQIPTAVGPAGVVTGSETFRSSTPPAGESRNGPCVRSLPGHRRRARLRAAPSADPPPAPAPPCG